MVRPPNSGGTLLLWRAKLDPSISLRSEYIPFDPPCDPPCRRRSNTCHRPSIPLPSNPHTPIGVAPALGGAVHAIFQENIMNHRQPGRSANSEVIGTFASFPIFEVHIGGMITRRIADLPRAAAKAAPACRVSLAPGTVPTTAAVLLKALVRELERAT